MCVHICTYLCIRMYVHLCIYIHTGEEEKSRYGSSLQHETSLRKALEESLEHEKSLREAAEQKIVQLQETIAGLKVRIHAHTYAYICMRNVHIYCGLITVCICACVYM